MSNNLNFHNINYTSNVKELEFKVEFWISDLTFFKTEIEFLKKILNTYPFISNTRNLFENIQIFNTNLDNFESKRLLILNKLSTVKQQLSKNNKEGFQKKHSQFINEFNNLEDEILTFIETYKSLKKNIYNYVYTLSPS